MPTLHLVHGFIGAGKTTYSQKLEESTGSIRFSQDEFMLELLGRKPPEYIFQKFYKKVSLIIWTIASKLLLKGIDVILDEGFWNESERAKYNNRAISLGANIILHNVKCDLEICLKRTLNRNIINKNSLIIDKKLFYNLYKTFEPYNKQKEKIKAITIYNTQNNDGKQKEKF